MRQPIGDRLVSVVCLLLGLLTIVLCRELGQWKDETVIKASIGRTLLVAHGLFLFALRVSWRFSDAFHTHQPLLPLEHRTTAIVRRLLIGGFVAWVLLIPLALLSAPDKRLMLTSTFLSLAFFWIGSMMTVYALFGANAVPASRG